MFPHPFWDLRHVLQAIRTAKPMHPDCFDYLSNLRLQTADVFIQDLCSYLQVNCVECWVEPVPWRQLCNTTFSNLKILPPEQPSCARWDSWFLQLGRITFSSFLRRDSSQLCCNHLPQTCWIREAIFVCPVVSWKCSHNSTGVLECMTHPSCRPGWKRAVTWANNFQVDTHKQRRRS